MKKIICFIFVIAISGFFYFQNESNEVKKIHTAVLYKDNSFFKQPFRQRALKVLAQNKPTVIVEASMHGSDGENIVDSQTIFDPIFMFNSYQFGLIYSLYARPIDIKNDGTYTSSILKKFTYNKKNPSLTLTLKKNLTYDNSEAINAEELAFAILRVAYHRRELSPL